MKILLVGEYSRLHNSLKEGLAQLGHEAVIVSSGDAFKGYATDYSVAPRLMQGNSFFRLLKKAVYRLTKLDLEATERGLRFYRLLPKLKGYGHVQLINSDAIETHPWLSKKIYKKLFAQNGPVSLLICGDDYPVVEYALSGKLKYSILTPYLNDKSLQKQFHFPLKYVQQSYKYLFNWLNHRVVLITSDLDYEVPMKALGYDTQLIPNPINIDTIDFTPLEVHQKLIIFLGINRMSYIKKGIAFFEEALEIIRKKYPDKIEIIITENIPYARYIELYNSAHILLDQVYAYDQGYNALEAMAKGKVVFTGAETEFTQYYNLADRVAINAMPDAQAIADKLSYLIKNPAEVIAMGKRARAFIEKEHDYVKVAAKYLEVWGEPSL